MTKSGSEKSVVTVTIAGESYTIRAQASPDYTRSCAEYVDTMIQEIRAQSPLMDPLKAAILVSMAITDQLFQARIQGDALRDEGAAVATSLIAQIENALSSGDLAARS